MSYTYTGTHRMLHRNTGTQTQTQRQRQKLGRVCRSLIADRMTHWNTNWNTKLGELVQNVTVIKIVVFVLFCQLS